MSRRDSGVRPARGRRFGAVVATVGALASVVSLSTAGARESLSSPVQFGPIFAQFFANPTGDGAFTATPSLPVQFTETFPVINFNPPPGRVSCRNQTNVDVNTRPFTDVIPQPGRVCLTQVAAGSVKQAGVGSLFGFNTVFTTTLTVAATGPVTFEFYADDGWILGVGPGPGGAQASFVSGSQVNMPRTTPFEGYPALGALNQTTPPTGAQLVVDFPAAGSYPLELDYSEGAGGQLSFTVQANGSSIEGSPPPPPQVGKSVNVQPVTGTVLLRLPHTKTFVRLTSLEQVPVGSEFDATLGRIRLTSAAGAGATQTADFYQGRFIFTQATSSTPISTLRLSAPLACGARSLASSTKKRRVRKLWGSGSGRFRTVGLFAAATVRGTTWLTEDRCTSTLVYVRSGHVDVYDFVLKRHFLVGPGQTHVARRRRS